MNRREVLSNDESRVHCRIIHELFKQMHKIPLSKSQIYFSLNEENLMATYCRLGFELKVESLSKFIKQGQMFDIESVPFHIGIFNPKVKSGVRVLSQILGLDNDRIVNEVILVILVPMESIEENQVLHIQVDEFLAETMDSQLVNLSTLKHFRY